MRFPAATVRKAGCGTAGRREVSGLPKRSPRVPLALRERVGVRVHCSPRPPAGYGRQKRRPFRIASERAAIPPGRRSSAALIPFQRSGHRIDERRHPSRGGKHAAHHDRPRIKAADEIEAELLGRVTDHHGVGEGPAQQVFREPHLLIKFGDGGRGRRHRMAVGRFRHHIAAGCGGGGPPATARSPMPAPPATMPPGPGPPGIGWEVGCVGGIGASAVRFRSHSA